MRMIMCHLFEGSRTSWTLEIFQPLRFTTLQARCPLILYVRLIFQNAENSKSLASDKFIGYFERRKHYLAELDTLSACYSLKSFFTPPCAYMLKLCWVFFFPCETSYTSKIKIFSQVTLYCIFNMFLLALFALKAMCTLSCLNKMSV